MALAGPGVADAGTWRYAPLQQEVFPRTEVTVLPDSGHWSFVDDPQAVEGIVTEFLRRQVHASAARRS